MRFEACDNDDFYLIVRKGSHNKKKSTNISIKFHGKGHLIYNILVFPVSASNIHNVFFFLHKIKGCADVRRMLRLRVIYENSMLTQKKK